MKPLSSYDTHRWLVTRQHIWERDNGKCRICGHGGRDVHHTRYDKGFYNETYLILVCRPCHNIWQGAQPDHIPDDHELKPKLIRLAELARWLGRKPDLN